VNAYGIIGKDLLWRGLRVTCRREEQNGQQEPHAILDAHTWDCEQAEFRVLR